MPLAVIEDAPVDFSYGPGQFSTFYLQQFNLSATHPLGSHFNMQAAYAGTHERSVDQWQRQVRSARHQLRHRFSRAFSKR